MRRKNFWIAAGCILALTGLLPVVSSGASPASKEEVLYSFTGAPDGAEPMSDLTIDSAGNLYGTTSRGGTGNACNGGCGTVFELKRSQGGWKEEVLYNFTGNSDGASPQTGLIFDSAGNLYGTTPGNVFELSPKAHGEWTETVLYSFNFSSDGVSPVGALVFDRSGNLYGANSAGVGNGNACFDSGCGSIFELTPKSGGSWTETTIHKFFEQSPDGAVPASGVVLDRAGNVYGATLYGGTGSCRAGNPWGYISGCGTIYEASPGAGGTWTESVLYSFDRGGGLAVYPSGGLSFDESGHLLGTSTVGGDGLGTVFELSESQKTGWHQSLPYIFYGAPNDGITPVGRLLTDSEGNWFGVTSTGGAGRDGGGTVFELERLNGGWNEEVLHRFQGSDDGRTPRAGLVRDSQGHLYGTTQFGGTGAGCNSGCGTVYEVTP